MYYLAKFSTGYCGEDETIAFKSNTRQEVEDYCNDYFPDYLESWGYIDEEDEEYCWEAGYSIKEYGTLEEIDGCYDSFEDFTK